VHLKHKELFSALQLQSGRGKLHAPFPLRKRALIMVKRFLRTERKWGTERGRSLFSTRAAVKSAAGCNYTNALSANISAAKVQRVQYRVSMERKDKQVAIYLVVCNRMYGN
jgi:hypothetical protein